MGTAAARLTGPDNLGRMSSMGPSRPGVPPARPPHQPAPQPVTWGAPYGLAHPAPLPGGQPPMPPRVYHRPTRSTVARPVLWVAVILGLSLCALITLVVIGLVTGGAGGLVGALLAVLPVFPVVAAFLWLDRYESEPASLLAFAFAWGATAAVVISLIFSIGSMLVIGDDDFIGAVIVAPVVEEPAKGLAILGVLLIRRRQFHGVIDGIVYAGMSGVGFAFAENILYLGSEYQTSGLGGAITLFLIRCVMGPFAHPMFTAAFGIGIGLAVRTPRVPLKILYPLTGLAVAMLLHALWNLLAMTGGGFLVGYVLLQLPIFVTFVVFAIVMRAREGKMLHRHLQVYARTGWITPQELSMLSSPLGRRQAQAWAMAVRGGPGKRAMREFQELAGELAFLRDRIVNHSAGPRCHQLEEDLLRSMWQRRQGFAVPAPVATVRPW